MRDSLPKSWRDSGTVMAAAWLAMAILASIGPMPAWAETQISVYGGMNENFSSRVKTEGPVTDNRTIDWDGKSFQMPPYWGARGTYWFGDGPGWGVAIDYTHVKAYADVNFATDLTYDHLEFTDGLNLLTLNLLHRFNPLVDGTLVPYAGLGVGVAIPHVEVTFDAVSQRTFEYQLTGVAAQALAGLEFRLGRSWSVFSEAKLSYAKIDADLTSGGKLSTDIWSPQFAVGLTYRFGRQ